jgi:hypothetical protein
MRKGATESSTYTHIAAQIVRSMAFLKIIEENLDLLPSPEAERKILNSTSGLRDEYRRSINRSMNLKMNVRVSCIGQYRTHH